MHKYALEKASLSIRISLQVSYCCGKTGWGEGSMISQPQAALTSARAAQISVIMRKAKTKET
jgi:hypothetical protein